MATGQTDGDAAHLIGIAESGDRTVLPDILQIQCGIPAGGGQNGVEQHTALSGCLFQSGNLIGGLDGQKFFAAALVGDAAVSADAQVGVTLRDDLGPTGICVAGFGVGVESHGTQKPVRTGQGVSNGQDRQLW